ncbi:MAG: LLM class flavin-dependent oxidoreductase [Chloroflexi bacterium]|nr:LLM class flavin-dependent oxidoreductase [Chloroflexota bacterium]
MRIGTYHTFQHPEWTDQRELYHQEFERLELAERLGYDDVWIPEQHFTRYCLAGDPLALASHAAARTKRVRIGIAVMNLSFAHPLRLAEEAAIVDVLSRGRLDMGIGRGYQPIQYPVFGVAMEETRQRFEEVLEVLLKAWGTERFTHDGRFFHYPEVSVFPRPYNGNSVSLIMASNSKDSAQIAGAKGLPALMARPFTTNERIGADLDAYTSHLRESGRSDAAIDMLLDKSAVMKLCYVAPTDREAYEEPREALRWHVDILRRIMLRADEPAPATYDHMRERHATLEAFDYDAWWRDVLIFGSPARVLERVRELQRIGVRRLILWHGPGAVEHVKVVRSMELFAKEVRPGL